MAKKGYTSEQIINKLREAEVLLSQGATTGEASRKVGITEQTYYRWRKGIFIRLFGIIGNAFLLIGIITAALNTSIAGFTPAVWMLLAFILYMIIIFSVILRSMTHLKSQP